MWAFCDSGSGDCLYRIVLQELRYVKRLRLIRSWTSEVSITVNLLEDCKEPDAALLGLACREPKLLMIIFSNL